MIARTACGAAVVAAALFGLACQPRQAVAMEKEETFALIEVEQLEYRIHDGREVLAWDVKGWAGGDYRKLWVKSEGEGAIGQRLESAEVQVLYSRLLDDFFDLQAGIRQDFKPDPDRTFAVLGLHGLAKYFFETDVAAFMSNKGEVSFRAEAEIDLRVTQRLVLQPSAEIDVAVQGVAGRGIGSGLNSSEIGLRLRYEIAREFAPYVGVNWERKYGETRDLAREEGERSDTISLVLGVGFWF